MKQKIYYIQPLNKIVIGENPLYKDEISVTKLTKELRYKKDIMSAPGTPRQILLYAVRKGKVKPRGWIKIELDRSINTWEDVWPTAMQKLGTDEQINVNLKKPALV